MGDAARPGGHPRAHAPPRRRGAIELSLTDRGLLDLDVVFVAAATLSFAAGLAWGRLWALLLAVAITALVYLGIERSWWGGGFVDGWEAAYAFHTVAAVIVAAGGVIVHRAVAAAASERVDLPSWSAPGAVLAAAAVAIGGFWYVYTRPPDVTGLRASGPLYYLGETFEELTRAEASAHSGFFAYGGCDTRIAAFRCSCRTSSAPANEPRSRSSPGATDWRAAQPGHCARSGRTRRPEPRECCSIEA